LRRLPGIGPYTAAAVASVAGNRDVPVIDANVMRVYARLFDLDLPVKSREGQRRLTVIAEGLLPPGRARLFNQALMDLGGLVCTPKAPSCPACPIAGVCLALQAGTVAERPVVAAKKKLITVQKVAAIIRRQGRVFIQQRRTDDLWGGLWEFPGGELAAGQPAEAVIGAVAADTGLAVRVVEPLSTVIHHYTRYKIILHPFLCDLEGGHRPTLAQAVDFRWVFASELHRYAFPAGPRKLLERLVRTNQELFAPRR
jgi:A/G-specific adenine glycosylase